MRVIVADDSAVIREGVVRILASAGMNVVAEARDADQLLAAVETHRPDLAVVDIRMPPGGNAGLKAAEQIRDRYEGAVGVLVLSQYLEPDYALRLLGPGVGGVGYLLKDRVVEGRELVEASQRICTGARRSTPRWWVS
jgi:DNA-binding NarL/FixJ family response regulator